MSQFNYLSALNADYIDNLFDQYSKDPQSLEESWRYFFEGVEFQEKLMLQNGALSKNLHKESQVTKLIEAYRAHGHLIADLNPLETPSQSHPFLDLKKFNLTENDLDKKFTAATLIGLKESSLKDILASLKNTYCNKIGVEYSHINDPNIYNWLQKKMEPCQNQESFTDEQKKHILSRLTQSETFEHFLHTRYVAQKRFSIEGSESIIPAIDQILDVGEQFGGKEFVFGMAHRGRLNVLINIFDKKPEFIFTEFEQNYKTDTISGEGDVKYHMGFSADINTLSNQPIHISMASNPSHLEFVDPVVEGIARGKQRATEDTERKKIIPILIHGDAAFAGQGIVYETLNLSQLDGYCTGGTIHLIINNQIGFTTDPKDSRSTPYATDLAKMLEVPIFHVNCDDPEAVCYVSKLATEFRQKFKQDVFIDFICYRRYGHNEGDEPAFTQPLVYKKIKEHPTTRSIYAQQLISQGVYSEEKEKSDIKEIIDHLTISQKLTRDEKPKPVVQAFQSAWKDFHLPTSEELFEIIDTSVDKKTLKKIGKFLYTPPKEFNVHPKLERFLKTRATAIKDETNIDWGNGESLAYATLLQEGHTVRLSGQDVERGTFSHRHAVLHDIETNERFVPLNQLAHQNNKKADFIIQNSHLSEAGVLGFEFGWSLADPTALVIWEAQFGDFLNSAQVIVDQFISSGESKWNRCSGLVAYLPHGYEGQGPEHSSARLERFLQLCGKLNMTVCNLTTPAQLFHVLRRQIKRKFRKPLIIMSPKSLLRHPKAVSNLSDFSSGFFHEVVLDPLYQNDADYSKNKRVILCSGKIYYELLAEREKRQANDIAIIRVEQLYPWPTLFLTETLKKFPKTTDYYWVQEEPLNMGAWSFIFNTWYGSFDLFQEAVHGKPIHYIGRDRAAASAVGSAKRHAKEQQEILNKSMGG